jgi:hypothetical protein
MFQTDIATSTVEAEYSALSMGLRSVILLLEVVCYFFQSFDATTHAVTRFLTTAHEDNQGTSGQNFDASSITGLDFGSNQMKLSSSTSSQNYRKQIS